MEKDKIIMSHKELQRVSVLGRVLSGDISLPD